jgi:hypothetical protein
MVHAEVPIGAFFSLICARRPRNVGLTCYIASAALGLQVNVIPNDAPRECDVAVKALLCTILINLFVL